MKTRKMLLSNEELMRFAEHFKTKSSSKNLLQGVKNQKLIQPLFDEERFGKELLAYSNLEEKFDEIVETSMVTYAAQVAAWRTTGDNRPLPARVQLLKDIIAGNVPAEVGGTLGDFMKTSTGKEINKVLTNAGIEEGSDLYVSILIWIATKSIMVSSTIPVETVDGDIIIETASHSVSGEAKNPLIEDKNLAENIDKAVELIENLTPDSSSDELMRVVAIIKPSIRQLTDELIDKIVINKDDKTYQSFKEALIKRGLPEASIDAKTDKIISFLSSLIKDDDKTTIVVMENVFFITLNTINHINDEQVLVECLRLVIAIMDSKDNGGAIIAETLRQADKVVAIIESMKVDSAPTSSTSCAGTNSSDAEEVEQLTGTGKSLTMADFRQMGREFASIGRRPVKPSTPSTPTSLVEVLGGSHSMLNRATI